MLQSSLSAAERPSCRAERGSAAHSNRLDVRLTLQSEEADNPSECDGHERHREVEESLRGVSAEKMRGRR